MTTLKVEQIYAFAPMGLSASLRPGQGGHISPMRHSLLQSERLTFLSDVLSLRRLRVNVCDGKKQERSVEAKHTPPPSASTPAQT